MTGIEKAEGAWVIRSIQYGNFSARSVTNRSVSDVRIEIVHVWERVIIEICFLEA